MTNTDEVRSIKLTPTQYKALLAVDRVSIRLVSFGGKGHDFSTKTGQALRDHKLLHGISKMELSSQRFHRNGVIDQNWASVYYASKLTELGKLVLANPPKAKPKPLSKPMLTLLKELGEGAAPTKGPTLKALLRRALVQEETGVYTITKTGQTTLDKTTAHIKF